MKTSESKVPDWIKDIVDLKDNNNSSNFYEKIKSEILSPQIVCFTPK
jgi:(p)ppGpp synthase/HD superfamily hydrolase